MWYLIVKHKFCNLYSFECTEKPIYKSEKFLNLASVHVYKEGIRVGLDTFMAGYRVSG